VYWHNLKQAAAMNTELIALWCLRQPAPSLLRAPNPDSNHWPGDRRTGTAMRIDCDVHPTVPNFATLVPYMEEYWQDQVITRGLTTLDPASYRPSLPLVARPDWREPNGRAALSLEKLRAELLDPFGIDIAILNVIHAGASIFNPYFGGAVCSATNKWLAEEWLARDDRLRASIVVAVQEPDLAAKEIDRVAPDERFVQVLLPVAADMPLGRKYYWPIYAAAAKHGLPVAIHPGGGGRHQQSYIGTHSSYAEDYYLQSSQLKGQLLSLIYEGVFTEYPDLTVVLLESGVTWLPNFLTDADNKWKGLRREVPWVTELPSNIVRKHVRLAAQPFDAPAGTDYFEKIWSMLGSDEMLLFATDYPHWQFEGRDPFPAGSDEAQRDRIARLNPLTTFPRLAGGRNERSN
jgi:predicted TIM-barrel fold metal-dependent hydrolase